MSVPSLNKVMLIGNLTRDPVMRFTPTGSAVCNFSIATNRSWTSRDGGEKQEEVEFHNLVAWTKLAEICGQILHKGDKVYVEGRLQTREWQNKEGQNQRTTEVILDNMISLSSRGAGAGAMSGDEASAAPAAAKPAAKRKKAAVSEDSAPSDQVADVQDVTDDVDIPF